MSFAMRCMKCRGRNTMRRQPTEYKKTPTCKHCKSCNRFYLDKARQYRKDYCSCEGYHFTHRHGTTFCIHNPGYEINVRTVRYGEALEDVLADIARREKEEMENKTNGVTE
jgi:hypothetical protein